jgi:glycine/D-amino acid oxidase-like deaminating enzyme
MKSLLLSFLLLSFLTYVNAETKTYDIVIYGGTSSGVIAAIQASRLGKSVILIHPGKNIGGATSNGLGMIDSNRHSLIGGLTREFFHSLWQYYQNEAVWKFEAKHLMKNQQNISKCDEQTMWVLEPHVAESIFNSMLRKARVPVILNERLD